MRIIVLAILTLLLAASTAQALCFVRIADLQNTPLPQNPVKICGRVTSEVPLTVSDGRGKVEIAGISAKQGDFLVLVGNYANGILTVTGQTHAYIGPAQLEMVYIPAGSFLMGSSEQELDSYTDERPQHSVSLSGYFIGLHEVTRGEYRKFMDAGGYSNPAYWSTEGWAWKNNTSRTAPTYWATQQNWGTPPGPFTQSDDAPVVGVNYYEAEAFCNWAGCSLPTEAQWEKAARWNSATGHSNVYPWGDTWNGEKCNNWLDTLYPGCQTSPAGSYTAGASPYGCQDMAGNVLEWCRDWYDKNYYSQTPAGGWTDPTGPTTSTYRVLRGGSWSFTERECRSAFRYNMYAYVSYYYYGFRVAR